MDLSEKCIYFLLVDNQECNFEIGKKRTPHFLKGSMYMAIESYY